MDLDNKFYLLSCNVISFPLIALLQVISELKFSHIHIILLNMNFEKERNDCTVMG